MKDEYDFSSAKRGPVVPLPPHQTEIRLRLDNEVLDWLRKCANEANGGSYQDTINAVLRIHMDTLKSVDPIELVAEGNENRSAIREKVLVA